MTDVSPALRQYRPLAALILLALHGNVGAAEPIPGKQGLDELTLVAHGGPLALDAEVEVNGEFALSIVDEPTLFTKIADLLEPGLNTLRVVLKQPDSPRSAGDRLEIAVAWTKETSRRQSMVGHPLAELVIPVDAAVGCEETTRFWVGPAPPPASPTKNQYFLFVTGPAVGLRVAVIVNGTLIRDWTEGNQFFEITPFVLAGKNVVEFDSRPTCLVEKSAQDKHLTFEIGVAKTDADTIEQTEPPAVLIEFAGRKSPEPELVKRTFRAR